jgi:hypothetical protein
VIQVLSPKLLGSVVFKDEVASTRNNRYLSVLSNGMRASEALRQEKVILKHKFDPLAARKLCRVIPIAD